MQRVYRRPGTGPALQPLVFSLWYLLHIQGPKHPWQLAGWVWRGSFLACLLASWLQSLGKLGRRTENRRFSRAIQTPRSLLFIPRSLILFESSHYFELYSLLLPWLGSPAPVHEVSIKSSDEQLSLTSSAALPQDTSGKC